MKFSKIFATVAVLGLVVSGANFADARSYNGHYGNGMSQLSTDQYDKLEKMREDNDNKMRPAHRELQAKRLELNALSNNANTDPKTISKLVKEVTELRNKIDDNRVAFSGSVESKFGIQYGGHRMGGNRGGHGGGYCGSGRGNGGGHYR